MNNNQIRRKIIEELYKSNEKKPGLTTPHGRLRNEIGIEDNELDRNINYLKDKGYIHLTTAMDYYAAKITDKGIDLIEDNNEFNTKFPLLSINQNIVQNSTNVNIGSNNSINISDSFNQIYQDPNFVKANNKEEIQKIILEIQKELQNDAVSKSKIKDSVDWLRTNAKWTIPTIAQIVTAVMLGTG